MKLYQYRWIYPASLSLKDSLNFNVFFLQWDGHWTINAFDSNGIQIKL